MRAAFQTLVILLVSFSGVLLLSSQSAVIPLETSPALVPPAAALLVTLLLLAMHSAIYRFFGENPSGNNPQSGADQ